MPALFPGWSSLSGSCSLAPRMYASFFVPSAGDNYPITGGQVVGTGVRLLALVCAGHCFVCLAPTLPPSATAIRCPLLDVRGCTYSVRRMHRELLEAGERVSRKLVRPAV